MRAKANLLLPSLNTTFYQALSLSYSPTIKLFLSSSFLLFSLILLSISISFLLPSPASLKQYRPYIDPMSLLQHEWGGRGGGGGDKQSRWGEIRMWVNNRNEEVEKEGTIERWWRWWCRENSRIVVVKQRGKLIKETYEGERDSYRVVFSARNSYSPRISESKLEWLVVCNGQWKQQGIELA